MDHKLNLLAMLKEFGLKKGDFTLKSGRKSNYLVDCKDVVLSAMGQRLVGDALHDVVYPIFRNHYELMSQTFPAVAGVELGGCPLATAVAFSSTLRGGFGINAIFVRKERKDHGSKSLLEGMTNLHGGAPVIVLEDVATTGGSAMFAVEQLWKYGANVLGVCVLVDREEGAREAIESKKLQFWSLFTKNDFGV